MIPALTALVLLGIGWIFGGLAQRRHLAELVLEEERLGDVLVHDLDLRKLPDDHAAIAPTPRLVNAEVILANDYLKAFLASLVNIFGGEVGSYRLLMARARREALVRLQSEARAEGFDAIANVRLETTAVSAMSFAVMAWGTAYRRQAAEGDTGAQPR